MLLTVVIPTHNEERNVPLIFVALEKVMSGIPEYEWNVLFVDDGSTDNTMKAILDLAENQPRVRFVELSRNFGKEIATTAGLHRALAMYEKSAQEKYSSVITSPRVSQVRTHITDFAVILMDADLQHPPEMIPTFIEEWVKGGEMIVGVRKKNHGEGLIKKVGSYVFNNIMKLISDRRFTPRSTDFRLISLPMLVEFARFTEHGRMTRGLLDWLGFRQVFVEFIASERKTGEASYSYAKLLKLAMESFLSHSLFPLKIAGYLGIIITLISGPILCFMMLDRYAWGNIGNFNFSGPAVLAMLNLTLIGIVLTCLGLVALYIGTIHKEAMNRPLYVVKTKL
ncbi:MAG: glycosyltransferase family 2 protein [Patescibacteria group bacterium]